MFKLKCFVQITFEEIRLYFKLSFLKFYYYRHGQVNSLENLCGAMATSLGILTVIIFSSLVIAYISSFGFMRWV